MQDCSNSSVLAMELLQSCTESSIYTFQQNNSARKGFRVKYNIGKSRSFLSHPYIEVIGNLINLHESSYNQQVQ